MIFDVAVLTRDIDVFLSAGAPHACTAGASVRYRTVLR